MRLQAQDLAKNDLVERENPMATLTFIYYMHFFFLVCMLYFYSKYLSIIYQEKQRKKHVKAAFHYSYYSSNGSKPLWGVLRTLGHSVWKSPINV